MRYLGLIGLFVVAFIAFNGLQVKNTSTRTEKGEASHFLIEPIKDEPCVPKPSLPEVPPEQVDEDGQPMPQPESAPAPTPAPKAPANFERK